MEPREALLRDVEQFEPEQVDAILQAPRLNLPMPGTPPCVQEYLDKVALRLQSIPGFLVNRKAKESKDQRRVNRESGWVCCGCGFVSTTQSPSRLLRHIIGEVSVDMWKTFHDGAQAQRRGPEAHQGYPREGLPVQSLPIYRGSG